MGTISKLLQELNFPHSLGLLYSAFTTTAASALTPANTSSWAWRRTASRGSSDLIYRELLDLKPDGSFWLNLEYFNFLSGTTMTNERFDRLFGGPPRKPEENIEPRHMDVARSIQAVTEEIMLRLARHARALTGEKSLLGRRSGPQLRGERANPSREGIFDKLWIQPAAGDAGGALGAALAAWHMPNQEGAEPSETM